MRANWLRSTGYISGATSPARKSNKKGLSHGETQEQIELCMNCPYPECNRGYCKEVLELGRKNNDNKKRN